jgi:hypothetical protein
VPNGPQLVLLTLVVEESVGRLLVPYCLTGDNIPHTTCTDWAVTCSSAGVTASKPQITPAFIIFWLGGATRFPMYVIIRDLDSLLPCATLHYRQNAFILAFYACMQYNQVGTI